MTLFTISEIFLPIIIKAVVEENEWEPCGSLIHCSNEDTERERERESELNAGQDKWI